MCFVTTTLNFAWLVYYWIQWENSRRPKMFGHHCITNIKGGGKQVILKAQWQCWHWPNWYLDNMSFAPFTNTLVLPSHMLGLLLCPNFALRQVCYRCLQGNFCIYSMAAHIHSMAAYIHSMAAHIPMSLKVLVWFGTGDGKRTNVQSTCGSSFITWIPCKLVIPVNPS